MRPTRVIARLAPSQLIGQLVKVASGNVAQRALGGVMLILLARWLPPAKFGALSLAYTIMVTGAQVPAGLGSAFVALYKQKVAMRAALTSAHLLASAGAGASIATVGAAISPLLASQLFREPGLTPTLILAFGGAGLTAFFVSGVAYLQAVDRFGHLAAMTAGSAAAALGAVWLVHALEPTASVLGYLAALVGVAAVAAGAAFLVRGHGAASISTTSRVMRLYLRTAVWPVLSTAGFALTQGLDILLLASFAGQDTVGLYSAAVRYSALFAIALVSFNAVALPRAAESSTGLMRRAYLHDVARVGGVLLLVSAALCLAAPALVPALFGNAYAPSIRPAQVLIVGLVPMIASIPFVALFYSVGRLRWVAAVTATQLATMTLAGLSLVRPFGGEGMAFAAGAGRLAGLVTAVVGLRVVWGRRWWRGATDPSPAQA